MFSKEELEQLRDIVDDSDCEAIITIPLYHKIVLLLKKYQGSETTQQ